MTFSDFLWKLLYITRHKSGVTITSSPHLISVFRFSIFLLSLLLLSLFLLFPLISVFLILLVLFPSHTYTIVHPHCLLNVLLVGHVPPPNLLPPLIFLLLFFLFFVILHFSLFLSVYIRSAIFLSDPRFLQLCLLLSFLLHHSLILRHPLIPIIYFSYSTLYKGQDMFFLFTPSSYLFLPFSIAPFLFSLFLFRRFNPSSPKSTEDLKNQKEASVVFVNLSFLEA